MRKRSLAVVAAIPVIAVYVGAPARTSDSAFGYAPHTAVVTAPHGTDAVSSYGLALLDPDTPKGQPIMTLHVRADVTATGTAPWGLDTSRATLVLADGQRRHPIAVNAELPTLPYLTLAPADRRVVDFYFAMPASVYDAADVTSFAFEWLGMRTMFSRVHADAEADIDVAAGRAHGWWFDPRYAWPDFHHVDGVITRKSPTAATIAWLHGDQSDSEHGELD